MKFLSQITKKILTVFLIINLLFLNFFTPLIVRADTYDLGDIKNATVSVGSLENEGDIEVTKTVTKTDNKGEYKVTFTVKGKPYTSLNEYNIDSYTVFVLDASYSMLGTKWNKAKEAAINFSETLVNSSDNNYLSLVTFNGSGMKRRDFKNEKFSNNDFGDINFYTNYNQGLVKALDYINGIDNEDAIYNIVFISDGEPNGEDYTDTLKKIKDKNVNIYSLAYDLKDNSNAYNILKEISTNDTVYEVTKDNISDYLSNIATEIIKKSAGTHATLEDKVGTNFTFKSGSVDVNNQDVSYEIGEITEEGISFDFIIKIDDDIDTGWYPTNEGFKLTYIDKDGNSKVLETDESAEVYWVSDKIDYNINYYNDDILLKTILKKAKNGTEIILTDDLINAYLEDGYRVKSINPTNLIIEENNNYIDIIYTKINDLKYKVEYYYDGIKDETSTETYENIEYGSDALFKRKDKDGYGLCLVLNDDAIITDNDTVISVYYCRNDYSYQVNYYYDDVIKHTENLSAKFDSIINSFPNKIEDGYELDKVINIPLSISSNVNNNIIDVFYKLRDVNYQVNYLDSNGNKIIPSRERKDKYGTNIIEHYEDIKGYKITGDKDIVFTLTDNNEINFYYDKIKSNVTFKYVDTLGNKISEDDTVTGYYNEPYSISIKEIDNYKYILDDNIYDGKISDKDEIITFVYKKIDDNIPLAPLTGINNKKYIFMISISLFGLIILITAKILFNVKK